jgi:hypothetical protein
VCQEKVLILLKDKRFCKLLIIGEWRRNTAKTREWLFVVRFFRLRMARIVVKIFLQNFPSGLSQNFSESLMKVYRRKF